MLWESSSAWRQKMLINIIIMLSIAIGQNTSRRRSSAYDIFSTRNRRRLAYGIILCGTCKITYSEASKININSDFFRFRQIWRCSIFMVRRRLFYNQGRDINSASVFHRRRYRNHCSFIRQVDLRHETLWSNHQLQMRILIVINL